MERHSLLMLCGGSKDPKYHILLSPRPGRDQIARTWNKVDILTILKRSEIFFGPRRGFG